MKTKKSKQTRPETLSKSDLGRRLNISRQTIAKYLGMPGAPAADTRGCYDLAAVAGFIGTNAPRAGEAEGIRALRAEKLRLECARLAHELKVISGEIVPLSEIEPAIAKMMSQLTSDLQAKFEAEIPSKCAGKSVIEIKQLMAEAIDYVLTRLKHGKDAIAPEQDALTRS